MNLLAELSPALFSFILHSQVMTETPRDTLTVDPFTRPQILYQESRILLQLSPYSRNYLLKQPTGSLTKQETRNFKRHSEKKPELPVFQILSPPTLLKSKLGIKASSLGHLARCPKTKILRALVYKCFSIGRRNGMDEAVPVSVPTGDADLTI